MIACDTSSLIAFLARDPGPDTQKVAAAFAAFELVLPPATYAEALSNPRTFTPAKQALDGLNILDIAPGYWLRVAQSRGTLIGMKLKARLADTLIAQSCIDAGVPLITRDSDFRHFATHCGLKLA